ncbi:alpha/beta-Hydrolases superfamily protein [Prunus dulcis]|uniref:Alpha/beta-Hydrolases superfamily protein n=1 Tax=Prunus dulcis TaxID=3755 RepID=A0A4Y1RM27_PRUDU|nr:alpha/beta-Hydrolases superfamily protein [Prunus dulcis]
MVVKLVRAAFLVQKPLRTTMRLRSKFKAEYGTGGVILSAISMLATVARHYDHWRKNIPVLAKSHRAAVMEPQNTNVGKYFFKTVATPESVRNILCQCYHDTSQVTEELVQKILLPGLEPGAVDVFLEFICYSGGPLPEELLPQVKCPVLIGWGEKDPWEPIELGRAYGKFDSVEDFVVLPNVGHCPQI